MYLETTARTVKVFIDDKHVKSFPLFLEEIVRDKITADTISKLNLKKKPIQSEDYAILNPIIFPEMVSEYEDNLAHNEKYVYELIQNAKAIGTRKVNSKDGKRFEIVYDNGVKLKCDDKLHKFSDNILPTVNLNY